MVDLSDGLGSDIGHVCDRSKVGVRIYTEKLPIPPTVRRVAELTGQARWDLALFGGEDFELCFTSPASAAGTITDRVVKETGTPVAVVGEILAASSTRWLVSPSGEEVPLQPRGFRHF